LFNVHRQNNQETNKQTENIILSAVGAGNDVFGVLLCLENIDGFTHVLLLESILSAVLSFVINLTLHVMLLGC